MPVCNNCGEEITGYHIAVWYGGNDPDGNEMNRYFCNDTCRDAWEVEKGLKEKDLDTDNYRKRGSVFVK